MAPSQGRVSDFEARYVKIERALSAMSMMRIAVAGTGGLARLIAHFIDQETSHHVVFLSREEKPHLSESNQVAIIDYSSQQSLQFALRGIDTVISTVTGADQIELIKAAVAVRVRRFAPAEFEGPPDLRPQDDPLDRGRTLARQWLSHYAQHIQSTTFVCGILYERFQPGGLRQARIGLASLVSGEGDYIMDCRAMSAEVPCYDANSDPNVSICLTAAQDVGKFVCKAIDLPQWPPEMRMCGQQIKVKDLVALVQQLKGQPFNPIQWHNPDSLRSALRLAAVQQDKATVLRLQTLLATAEGRFCFGHCNLNQSLPEVKTLGFKEWFERKWGLV